MTEADLTDTCRVNVPMDIHWLMDHQHTLIGSVRFTAGDGQAMVDMIDAGLLDLSPLQHNVFPLEQVNEAISSTAHRVQTKQPTSISLGEHNATHH